MTNELKPCPFCGDPMSSDGVHAFHSDKNKGCPINGLRWINPVLWNKRTPSTKQTGGMVSKGAVLAKLKPIMNDRNYEASLRFGVSLAIEEIEAMPCSNDKFVEALCSVTAAAKEMLSNLNNMDDEVEWPKSIERAEKLLKDKGSNKPENIMMETNLSFDEFNQEMAARGADVETGYVTDGNIHHNDDDKGAR